MHFGHDDKNNEKKIKLKRNLVPIVNLYLKDKLYLNLSKTEE